MAADDKRYFLIIMLLEANFSIEDYFFVIYKIINNEVSDISFRIQFRLKTLTKTLIILDVTKTETRYYFIFARPVKSCVVSFAAHKIAD